MNIGGVEKALLAELETYPTAKYDITLALLEKKGGFINYIPNDVKLIELSEYSTYKKLINNPPLNNIKEALTSLKISLAVKLLFSYICYKLTGTQQVLFNILFHKISPLNEKYDLAFAYAGPFPFIDYYVTKKVSAKEKEVWIHYDVSKINPDKGIITKLYRNYDKINIVSQQGKEIFDKLFPQYKEKTIFYPNKISHIKIKELALAEKNPFKLNVINILTVGRVSKEKGQFMTLEVLHNLIESGYNIVWHYVGDGFDILNCKQEAKRLNVEDYAIFHGAKANPYPYMKHCDIYVQPSIHEGFCITLAEAKTFEKPIIATNFTGAKEQLSDYKNGAVVSYSITELYNAIVSLITK